MKSTNSIKLLIILIFIFANIFVTKANITINESKDKLNIHIELTPISNDFKSLNLAQKRFPFPFLIQFENNLPLLSFKIASNQNIPNLILKNLEYDEVKFDKKTLDSIFQFPSILGSEFILKSESKQYLRGVNLFNCQVNLIKYNALENKFYFLRKADVISSYSFAFPIEKSNKDNEFAYDLANPRFFDFLSREHYNNLSLNNKLNKIQSGTIFPDPNKQYIKLQTNRIGIAKTKFSDLFTFNPSLKGKSINGIQLFKNGIYYDKFYIKSQDNILDENDELYFYCSHLYGDSTYYDFYSYNQSYFLTFDETQSNPRLNLKANDVKKGKQLNYLYSEKHIEKDFEFSVGRQFTRSETGFGEGWVWKICHENDQFANDLLFFPNPDINKKIGIFSNVNLLSYEEDLTRKPISDIDFYLNGIWQKKFKNEYYFQGNFGANYSSDDLISGVNNFKLFENKADISSDTINNRRSDMLINYITITGEMFPYAENDLYSFKIDSLSENSFAEIPGFHSENSITIDTIQNTISFNNNIRTTFISTSATPSTRSYSSIIINDSTYKSTIPGFLLAYQQPDGKISSLFSQNGIDISNLIATFNSNTLVALAINTDKGITSNLLKILKNNGAIKVDNFSSQTSYVLNFNLGVNNSIDESLNNTINSSITKIIDRQVATYYKTVVNFEQSKKSSFLISSSSNLVEPNLILPFVTKLPSDFTGIDGSAIYHNKFINGANRYLELRKKNLSNIKLNGIDIESIYDYFSFGNKKTQAIKDYLIYALNNSQDASFRYCTLIGDASWDANKILSVSFENDYIPSFGMPYSDNWYTYFDSNSTAQSIMIGRISCQDTIDLNNYLDKIETSESLKPQTWMKRFVNVSGGWDEQEQDQFYEYIAKYEPPLLSEFLNIDTINYRKTMNSIKNDLLTNILINEINKGEFWFNYFAHGSSNIIEIDGWNPELLNNKSKYPILSTLSCNTGAFAEPNQITRNEGYLYTKDKGFIAAFGSTATGDVRVDVDIMTNMMYALGDTNHVRRNLGVLSNIGRSRLGSQNLAVTNSQYQFSLLGDPLFSIKIDSIPELYFDESSIKISNLRNTDNFNIDDKVISIEGNIYNNGINNFDKFEVVLIRESNSKYDTISQIYNKPNKFTHFKFDIDISNNLGINKIQIIINPRHQISEIRYDNNIFSKSIEIFNSSLLMLDPQPNWNMWADTLKFRVINPYAFLTEKYYNFKIYEVKDSLIERINSSLQEIKVLENYIEWNPNVTLKENTNYLFEAVYIDSSDANIKIYPLQIPFYVQKTRTIIDTVDYKLFKESFSKFKLNNSHIENDSLVYKIKLNKYNYNYRVEANDTIKGRFFLNRIWNENGDKILTFNDQLVGWAIVQVSLIDNNAPYKIKQIRTYAEFADTSTLGARDLVNYLKDSLDNNSIIFISTSGECMSQFILAKALDSLSTGSIDTLHKVFRDLKCKYADSLYYLISYATVLQKVDTITVLNEYWHYRDALTIDGNFNIYDMIGTGSVPIVNLFDKFNNIKISGELDSTKFQITGENNITKQIDTLSNLVGSSILQLDSVNFFNYNNIKVDFTLNRTSIYEDPFISSFDFIYKPLTEYAVLKNKSITYLDSDVYERGYRAIFNTAYEKITERVKFDSTSLLVSLKSSQPDQNTTFDYINPISNNNLKATIQYQTNTLDSKNSIFIDANYTRLNELYKFNNTFKAPDLKVVEDTIKPWYEIFVDSVSAFDGMVTHTKPIFTIKLYDSSPLPILTATPIYARVNSYIILPGKNNLSYQLDTIFNQGNYKSKLTFTWDKPLDKGENILKVWTQDSRGNWSDTTTISLFVKDKKVYDNINYYPNPFLDHLSFEFDYSGPEKYEVAEFIVYDLFGSLVAKFNSDIQIGHNLVRWNGESKDNYQLSSGVYFIKMSIESQDGFQIPKLIKVIKEN